MNNILIRPATNDDLKSILHIYSQPDMNNENILPLLEAERIFKRINKYPNYKIYVAEHESQVIATFALLIMDNLAHMGAKSGIIEDFVVSEEWQGKGVGRKMMEFAMEVCRKHNCYKLVLSSNKKREKAHSFYKSLGFKKHGFSFIVDV